MIISFRRWLAALIRQLANTLDSPPTPVYVEMPLPSEKEIIERRMAVYNYPIQLTPHQRTLLKRITQATDSQRSAPKLITN